MIRFIYSSVDTDIPNIQYSIINFQTNIPQIPHTEPIPIYHFTDIPIPISPISISSLLNQYRYPPYPHTEPISYQFFPYRYRYRYRYRVLVPGVGINKVSVELLIYCFTGTPELITQFLLHKNLFGPLLTSTNLLLS